MNSLSIVDGQCDHILEVEFSDGTLSAGVCGLAVDAFAVPLHLGQVLVEHLTGAQRRHQVIKLAPVVLPVLFGLPSFPFFLPLFL